MTQNARQIIACRHFTFFGCHNFSLINTELFYNFLIMSIKKPRHFYLYDEYTSNMIFRNLRAPSEEEDRKEKTKSRKWFKNIS